MWSHTVSAHLSDLRHIGGALTLSPLQLRLQVLLFSSQLQCKTVSEIHITEINWGSTWQNVIETMWVLVWDVFQKNWRFPTLLHQLVSRSPAPELRLSGSSNKKIEKNDNDIVMTNIKRWLHGAMIIAPQWSDTKSWCGFLINHNTYFC